MNELHVSLKRTRMDSCIICIEQQWEDASVFPSTFPNLKRHGQLYAIRNSLSRREAYLNDTDQWIKVWAVAVWERVLWCDWAERRARDARAYIKGDLRSCHARRWEKKLVKRSAGQTEPSWYCPHHAHFLNEVAKNACRTPRDREKGNPPIFPFIKKRQCNIVRHAAKDRTFASRRAYRLRVRTGSERIVFAQKSTLLRQQPL